MKIGLNLSFAMKRWMEPEKLAKLIRTDLKTDHVQFSWDFIDPWWPEEQRDVLAKRFREAFEKEHVTIDCTFGGSANYCFAHLLAPDENQREAGFIFFKRAVDLTLLLGADVMGTPLGGFSYDDARNPERREYLYQEMLVYMRKLAEYGKEKGLREIHIEPTPLFTEYPSTIEESLRLMKDLEGTAIPIKLLIDWGHALFKPLLKEEADIEKWFLELAPYIGSIHLQQTDGLWDRHWDFTREGIVTPELMKRATAKAGLENIYQYLEVVTIFEDNDEEVLDRMTKTMNYLYENIE